MKLIHNQRHATLGRRIIARRDDGHVLIEDEHYLYVWVDPNSRYCAVYGAEEDQAAIYAELKKLRQDELNKQDYVII